MDDWDFVVPELEVVGPVVMDSVVMESVVKEIVVVGIAVVVGGGVVVHGPGVQEGFTGTVHVLVEVQSASVMSSDARQQSALKLKVPKNVINQDVFFTPLAHSAYKFIQNLLERIFKNFFSSFKF